MLSSGSGPPSKVKTRLEIRQFLAVVRAEYFHRCARAAGKAQEAPLVAPTGLAIRIHHELIGGEPERAARLQRVHLVAVEIGIACMEEPAPRPFDGDAGVTGSVPAQRYHQDFRRQAVKRPDRLETVPVIPRRVVGLPVAMGAPLSRTIALVGDKASWLVSGRFQFRRHDVHTGMGKVADAAGMVEIEMSENDVPDICSGKAEPFDLAQGGILLIQTDIQDQRP